MLSFWLSYWLTVCLSVCLSVCHLHVHLDLPGCPALATLPAAALELAVYHDGRECLPGPVTCPLVSTWHFIIQFKYPSMSVKDPPILCCTYLGETCWGLWSWAPWSESWSHPSRSPSSPGWSEQTLQIAKKVKNVNCKLKRWRHFANWQIERVQFGEMFTNCSDWATSL